MYLPLCRHIMTNGAQCQTPSLNHGDWCYFHSRLHQRHIRFRPKRAANETEQPYEHVELTALEDRESIQVALSMVINALASGQMESRRATALLYGLQIASSNAARLSPRPYSRNTVLNAEPTPAGYDLADPGATLELVEEYDHKAEYFDGDEDEEED
jgi:hypothetical protein